MFQYEYTVKGKMDIGKVWALYSDVSQWPKWQPDMVKVELEGDFAAGTKGTEFMKEMPPMPFTLEEVERNKMFVDSSTFDDVTVKIGHFISDGGNGEHSLRHTVTITGPDEAQVQELGENIVADIPDSMAKLFELAKIG
ncbi:MAG: hypothetical protein LBP21_08870 [Synergistaceae bacterium]|jgi:hypothetical protein|nr:hypothetical protein [Synergistaceae bacterium]